MTNAALERPAYIKYQQDEVKSKRKSKNAGEALSKGWGWDYYWVGYNSVNVVKIIVDYKIVIRTQQLKPCPYPEGSVKASLFWKGTQAAHWELGRYC